MANKYMTKYSTSLVEMQIKPWDITISSLDWLKMKSLTILSVYKGVDQVVEFAYIVVKMVKLLQLL